MKRILILLIFAVSSAMGQTYQPNWSSLDTRPVPQWFKDSKFGIFIHWGVYAVPGFCSKGNYAEWYQYGLQTGDTARVNYHQKRFGNQTYYQFADQFKAELFKPDEWASLIEKSGAKYIVLTTKHHDGYALWPSKEADQTWGFPWNSVTTGPKRDLVGDLFKAIRKTSVRPGMYYSLYEWFNPLWLKDKKRYVSEHQWPQMKDLINTYQPDVFWTDGDWDLTANAWKSEAFLAWLYNESPVKQQVVTYDRWGSGVRFKHGAVFTPEYQPNLDFEDHYWEESRGMGFSYGYNREEDAWDYNSTQSLVLQLIDKVSGGGNFLLDIGPDEHGKIPPIMQERLLQIGSWMDINKEAIYGTERWMRASQWSEGKTYKAKDCSGDYLLKITIDPDPGYAVKNCFFTYNAQTNNLYALLPKYPSDKQFVLQDIVLEKDTKIEFLETKASLKWLQKGPDVVVTLPDFDPNQIKSNYAYVLKISNSGAFTKKPKVSVNYLNASSYPIVEISAVPNSEIRYTLDGKLPDENATLYQGPISVKEDAELKVKAFSKNIMPSNLIHIPIKVPQWQKAIQATKASPGLALQVYEAKVAAVAELDALKPLKTKVVQQIAITDTTKKEYVAFQYNGLIKIPTDGVYEFSLASDDGSKLWIGDEVLDNDGPHGNIEKTGVFALKKGFHRFKLSFFQGSGEGALSLKVAAKDLKKQEVPQHWWFYPNKQ